MTLIDTDGVTHFIHDGETGIIAAMLERGCYVQSGAGGNQHQEAERNHQEITGESGQGNQGDSVQHRTEGESQHHGVAVSGYVGATGVGVHTDIKGELQQGIGNVRSAGTPRKGRPKHGKGNAANG